VLNAGKVALKSLSGIKKHLLTHCARELREKEQQVGSIARKVKFKYSHAEHVESESCVKYIGIAWRTLLVLIENSAVYRKM